MFNVNKVQPGMILTDSWRGRRVTVQGVVLYDRQTHGYHIDPDGSDPTHVIHTNDGLYSGNSGLFLGGDFTGADGQSHLELPSKSMFQAVVRSESETFMLENLFENETEAKTYASEHGFEYVCRGMSVRVPA